MKEGDQKHDSKGQFRKKAFQIHVCVKIDQKDRYGPGKKLRSLQYPITELHECVSGQNAEETF